MDVDVEMLISVSTSVESPRSRLSFKALKHQLAKAAGMGRILTWSAGFPAKSTNQLRQTISFSLKQSTI